MSKRNRIWPFGLTPASWFLSGKAQEQAKATYYYSGESLDQELLKIELGPNYTQEAYDYAWLEKCKPKLRPADYAEQLIELDVKHGRISEADSDLAMLDHNLKYGIIERAEYDAKLVKHKVKYKLFATDEEQAIAELDIEFSTGKLTRDDYNRKLADIKHEPYVVVKEMGIDPEMITQGYFELDWNDEFVKTLQSAGLTGKNDEEIVNKWFNAVCRTVLVQEQADQDYGFENKGRTDVEYRRANDGPKEVE